MPRFWKINSPDSDPVFSGSKWHLLTWICLEAICAVENDYNAHGPAITLQTVIYKYHYQNPKIIKTSHEAGSAETDATSEQYIKIDSMALVVTNEHSPKHLIVSYSLKREKPNAEIKGYACQLIVASVFQHRHFKSVCTLHKSNTISQIGIHNTKIP